ncbi:uncharacterized protein LOC106172026 [Lingula anatina]|uniref:Uncharacterized protein LOC106172026 n=1 Tax=Lingula anatina TaxID=7574 RepID=A0A1S3JD02_LINAN|nr:uncharacterized protein LOC106172026 [Lingula anatina]|eukprot:XP_013408056.1 uncharacterized protein LOC106172026 [Lingula anatina]
MPGGLGSQQFQSMAAGALAGAASVFLTYQAYCYYRRTHIHSQQRGNPRTEPLDTEMDIVGQNTNLSDSMMESPQASRTLHILNSPPRHADGLMPVLPESQKGEAQALLHLLYHIAEDQGRLDGYVHRGITCNLCGQSPVCGTRFKCANCIDYDVCERCEPKDLHNKTHLFIKIRIPLPPLANPRMPLFKPLYPGKEYNVVKLNKEEISIFKKETLFDQHELESLYDQYKSLCTTERGITRDVFDQCLGPLASTKNLVMDRMFKFYDRNDDKYIDFHEMVTGMSILVKGTKMDKLPYAFEGYDLENKGSISKENLRRMFKAYFNITIELVRDVVKACEEEMMANFDDSSGKPVSALFSAPIPIESTNNNIPSKQPFPGNPGGRETMWPVMEAMSQDAIEEMVDNIFKMAKLLDGHRMPFSKFKEITLQDGSLCAWFDALGTVF